MALDLVPILVAERKFFMANRALKETVQRLLPHVQKPAQYIGGEIGSVGKDPRQVRGKLWLPLPDAYALDRSPHGLQVLYRIMIREPQSARESAVTPAIDLGTIQPRQNPTL